MKRISFLGLGGAGQRHLRVVRKRLPEIPITICRSTKKTPVLTSRFEVESAIDLEKKYNVEVRNHIDELVEDRPDLIFISTPTAFHLNHSKIFLNEGVSVFCEKPSINSYEEAVYIDEICRKKRVEFFVSFQRMYHPAVEELKYDIDSIGQVNRIITNVNSHVPNWHPYEDFRNLYACRRDLGGGVVRTESHEINLIFSLFGDPEEINAKTLSRENFQLDVEDQAEIQLSYPKFTVFVKLDFLSGKNERVISISGEKGEIIVDFNKNSYEMFSNGIQKKTLNYNIEADELFEKQFDLYLNGKLNSGGQRRRLLLLGKYFDKIMK